MDHRAFLESLFNDSDELRTIYQEVMNEWQPEEPPMTTLYAALGHQIADGFHKNDPLTNHRIFSLIEQAIRSSDRDLVTAVATGLIEALANRATQSQHLWEMIKPLLGPATRHHAESWLSHGLSVNDASHPKH